MTWVRNVRGDGYVNTAGATSGKLLDSKGGPRVELVDGRGNTVAITTPDALESPAVTIAGPIACVFLSSTGEAVWRCVAAWRINGDSAEPIIVGKRPAGRLHLEFLVPLAVALRRQAGKAAGITGHDRSRRRLDA